MKKIITVLLAAAVIFGFAACSPSTVSYFGKDVLTVTVISTPDLFKGEILNPADVQLRVVYDDHTEETFTGAELGMTRKDWTSSTATGEDGYGPFEMTGDAEKDVFTVYYGVKTNDSDKVVEKDSDITIKTVDFHELVIDGSAVTSFDASSVDENILKKIIFKAYYNNGADFKTVSVTVADSLVPNLASSFDKKAVAGSENQVEIISTNPVVKIDPKWIVTITPVEEKTISGVKLVQKDGNEIFNIAEVPSEQMQKLSNVEFEVYLVYSDNTVAETALNKTTDYNFDFTDYNPEKYIFDGKSTQDTFKVTVTLTDTYKTAHEDELGNGTGILNGELKVGFAKDYAKAITATEKTNNLVKQGERISVDDFNFEVTEWASKAKYDTGDAPAVADQISLDVANMDFVLVPFGYSDDTANETTEVEVAFKYGDRTVAWNGNSKPTVTVENTPATT